ncbi:MAG: hypothetical protein A2503_16540 [Burkholderiales bacterium RIFOXYD12_FULL_59_19]|nr:MAG: hypothetical protein A2503_16540 [Burkholderiales bacterium RIFOXYD12_FULL_59_19]
MEALGQISQESIGWNVIKETRAVIVTFTGECLGMMFHQQLLADVITHRRVDLFIQIKTVQLH